MSVRAGVRAGLVAHDPDQALLAEGGERCTDHAASDAVELAGVVRGERATRGGESADRCLDSGALVGVGCGGDGLPAVTEALAGARTQGGVLVGGEPVAAAVGAG
jgi:hypothetical protein